MQQKNISITVFYDNNVYELNAYEGEYRSLMALIYDNIYTSEFGECRGMGRCGTCLIEIIEEARPLESMDRNESVTLKKMGISDIAVRLACQIPLASSLQGIKIKILQS